MWEKDQKKSESACCSAEGWFGDNIYTLFQRRELGRISHTELLMGLHSVRVCARVVSVCVRKSGITQTQMLPISLLVVHCSFTQLSFPLKLLFALLAKPRKYSFNWRRETFFPKDTTKNKKFQPHFIHFNSYVHYYTNRNQPEHNVANLFCDFQNKWLRIVPPCVSQLQSGSR